MVSKYSVPDDFDPDDFDQDDLDVDNPKYDFPSLPKHAAMQGNIINLPKPPSEINSTVFNIKFTQNKLRTAYCDLVKKIFNHPKLSSNRYVINKLVEILISNTSSISLNKLGINTTNVYTTLSRYKNNLCGFIVLDNMPSDQTLLISIRDDIKEIEGEIKGGKRKTRKAKKAKTTKKRGKKEKRKSRRY